MDHRAGRQEQQRLEERVRDQMENRGDVRADAAREKHEAELRDGGIRQHTLDVGLDQADRGRKQRGGGADHADQQQCVRRHVVDRMVPHHHIDAGGHHGGRMDQRADRCRAFHGIRQPGVQGKLRGLADGADQETDRNGRGRAGIEPRGLSEDIRVIQRAEGRKHEKDGQ